MEGKILIKAPADVPCDQKNWYAKYHTVHDAKDYYCVNPQLIRIESRSAIDVVAARVFEKGFLGIQENWYISCPNFGVAIPPISSLAETHWIMEKLMHAGMPAPDAVTVAQVLFAMTRYDGPDEPEDDEDEL